MIDFFFLSPLLLPFFACSALYFFYFHRSVYKANKLYTQENIIKVSWVSIAWKEIKRRNRNGNRRSDSNICMLKEEGYEKNWWFPHQTSCVPYWQYFHFFSPYENGKEITEMCILSRVGVGNGSDDCGDSFSKLCFYLWNWDEKSINLSLWMNEFN